MLLSEILKTFGHGDLSSGRQIKKTSYKFQTDNRPLTGQCRDRDKFKWSTTNGLI